MCFGENARNFIPLGERYTTPRQLSIIRLLSTYLPSLSEEKEGE